MVSLTQWLANLFSNLLSRPVELQVASLRPDIQMVVGLKTGTTEMLKCLELFKSWEARMEKERLSHDLATLSKDIHNLSERYQFLVTTSIDLAERGIVLSVKMIDLIVYVAETEGKGKGIADRLEGVVNIGQSVTEEAIHMRDAFSQAKEDLEGLRNDLEEKRLQLSRKVVKTGSWKSFFETMSVFIGTIAVVFGTLGFLAALPMGPAALVGVAAVAATSKATAAGGVLSIAARTLAEMLKSKNASAETKLDKIVDFLKTMENQLPVVVSHVSQLEEWWGQQGGTLTALMNRGRRFKIQGGKGGLRELEAIKIEWEHVKEEFQGYCGDVKSERRKPMVPRRMWTM